MHAIIEIEFETFGDLTTALYEAIKSVKREARTQFRSSTAIKRSLSEPAPFERQDDNCYGSYYITVKNDEE